VEACGIQWLASGILLVDQSLGRVVGSLVHMVPDHKEPVHKVLVHMVLNLRDKLLVDHRSLVVLWGTRQQNLVGVELRKTKILIIYLIT